MRSISGYVYLISGDAGRIKIGASADPAFRLTNLQVGNPMRLEILAAFGHAYPFCVEQEAHRILDDLHIIGEWFKVELHAAITAVTAAMRAVDLSPPMPAAIPPVIVDDDRPDEEPIKVDLSGSYTIPAVGPDSDAKWKIGYVRPMDGVPAGQQVHWMRAAGVHSDNLRIEIMPVSRPELELTMKDCRAGDGVFVWSPVVFEGRALAIEAEAQAKGARIVYAVSS